MRPAKRSAEPEPPMPNPPTRKYSSWPASQLACSPRYLLIGMGVSGATKLLNVWSTRPTIGQQLQPSDGSMYLGTRTRRCRRQARKGSKRLEVDEARQVSGGQKGLQGYQQGPKI